MGIGTKNRKKYDTMRAMVVKELAKKYEVSDSFVRMAVNGDRVSETAEAIKKEFAQLTKDISNLLNK